MFPYKSLVGTVIGAVVMCNLPQIAAQTLSAQDRMFVEEAAKGGLHEVRMARLGSEHGQSQAVKTLSQRLISDHSKGNQELEALAKQNGDHAACRRCEGNLLNSCGETKRFRLRSGIRQNRDSRSSEGYS
jgi:hypothetical protein